jgi:hypothetical protein
MRSKMSSSSHPYSLTLRVFSSSYLYIWSIFFSNVMVLFYPFIFIFICFFFSVYNFCDRRCSLIIFLFLSQAVYVIVAFDYFSLSVTVSLFVFYFFFPRSSARSLRLCGLCWSLCLVVAAHRWRWRVTGGHVAGVCAGRGRCRRRCSLDGTSWAHLHTPPSHP